MKILSIGNFSNPSWDGSLPDEEHIAGALEELGHEVTRCQREETGIPMEEFDFILVAQWNGYTQSLFELKLYLQCPLIYWAFDYQADGQEWHERLIKQSDLYLSKRIADSKYPNWQWLSQDFAPAFLGKTVEVIEKDIDVLFTGSYLPWATERNETLLAVQEKFNLVIHSTNIWPETYRNVLPGIMDDGLSHLYARAKVILSIDHTLEAGYWSDRNAQIMVCGERPLFRYVPLSETRFHDKVDYFYNSKDCLAKISERLLHAPSRTYETDLSGRGMTTCDMGVLRFARDNLKVESRVKDLLTIVEGIL